ncbi:MAG TPA: hypothetical protein ENI97_08225 [Gammaproteobacteria bacterium]|nr:hypothetical protein [Gammaproteobacteria bacterium]
MNDKQLERSLKQPEVPVSLEKKLRNNWHTQLKEQAGQRTVTPRMLMGVSTSVLLALLTLFLVVQQTTPAIVTLAMQDIASDAERNDQARYLFDDAMRVQLQSRNIQPPLPGMKVKMAKYCTLNKTKTTHLRIAGAIRGEVNLFIRDGGFDIPTWGAQQGEINSMQWQVIHPREGLSVLVMRSADMNPQNVAALIQEMFYA